MFTQLSGKFQNSHVEFHQHETANCKIRLDKSFTLGMWKNISALRVTGIISYHVAPTTSGASRPVSYELKVSNKNANEFQQQHHYELRFSLKNIYINRAATVCSPTSVFSQTVNTSDPTEQAM